MYVYLFGCVAIASMPSSCRDYWHGVPEGPFRIQNLARLSVAQFADMKMYKKFFLLDVAVSKKKIIDGLQSRLCSIFSVTALIIDSGGELQKTVYSWNLRIAVALVTVSANASEHNFKKDQYRNIA